MTWRMSVAKGFLESGLRMHCDTVLVRLGRQVCYFATWMSRRVGIPKYHPEGPPWSETGVGIFHKSVTASLADLNAVLLLELSKAFFTLPPTRGIETSRPGDIRAYE